MANSVDPDPKPRSVASELGLHCLFRPVLKLRVMTVKIVIIMIIIKIMILKC